MKVLNRIRLPLTMCLVTASAASFGAQLGEEGQPSPDSNAATGTEQTIQPIPTPTTPTPAAPAGKIGAYAEMYYQWNFNRPPQGLTNFRGFDNRHNTFTVSNAAVDFSWDNQPVIGKLTLQFGHTPSTYYLAEPNSPGASGANASDASLWKYVQQAYAGYRFGDHHPVIVTAGIFLSPIGPESMAVKDNWNWSRSNLFFGLPFYHTGVKVSSDPSKAWSVNAGVYNGWNSVVDNNSAKSVSAQLLYTQPKVTWSLLYFGGNERAAGAAEGSPWRHLFDSHVTWTASPRLSFVAHVNGGLERNAFGTARWVAGALYARYGLTDRLFAAARVDAFNEHVASSANGKSASIFWPTAVVTSSTLTLDYRPSPSTSFRLEYRHDNADGLMYFDSGATRSTPDQPIQPNADTQNTLALGLTSWF